MKRIAILGLIGSIGRSTLSVVESYPDRFQVSTLAAGNKDCGAILTGHAGMLDRIDAMLFAVPVVWAYGAWRLMQ